jgi:hypothetical protein
MGLFSKGSRDNSGAGTVDDSWIRTSALVIAADAPPEGAPRRGSYSQGTLQVFVDGPNLGRRTLSMPLPYADDHWVVAGMQVPIAIDPAHPETFQVDWPAVPSMRQQAQSNHPALADPFGASRQIAAAVGITPSAKTAARIVRFQAAVAAAATKPAGPGRLRAVAMTATIRGRLVSSGDADGGATRSGVTVTQNSAAVLSVAVPGRAPYAVYLPKFKFSRKHLAIPGEPMPALVDAADPGDVEILWDEMPALGDQIASRMADAARANQEFQSALGQQFQAAAAQAMSTPPPPAGMPAPTGLPPQARQLMIDNLRRSLLYVTDPAQRQLMLDQYRAMGLDLTREELGL